METPIHFWIFFRFRYVIWALSILFVFSCDSPTTYEKIEEETPSDEVEETPWDEAKPSPAPWDGIEEPPWDEEEIDIDTATQIHLDDYIVILDAQRIIKTRSVGELRVWIGAEVYKPIIGGDMVRDSITIPQNIAKSALIKAYAPDFDVEPKEAQCISIHPSGSSERFTLIPKKRGDFKVSAEVDLFNTDNCSGPLVRKNAETLTVSVKVDRKFWMIDRAEELLTIVWEKFLNFWGILVTLIFGLILFLLRRKLKKKTGFDGSSSLK